MPTPLDLGAEADVDCDEVLPLRRDPPRGARWTHWVAEDARSARAFLKRVHAVVPLALPLQAIQIVELPRPRKGSREAVPAPATWHALLAAGAGRARPGPDLRGRAAAVADPGAALVAAAHALGVAGACRWPAPVRCCWRWRPAA